MDHSIQALWPGQVMLDPLLEQAVLLEWIFTVQINLPCVLTSFVPEFYSFWCQTNWTKYVKSLIRYNLVVFVVPRVYFTPPNLFRQAFVKTVQQLTRLLPPSPVFDLVGAGDIVDVHADLVGDVGGQGGAGGVGQHEDHARPELSVLQ